MLSLCALQHKAGEIDTLTFQLATDGREVPRGIVDDPDDLRVFLEASV